MSEKIDPTWLAYALDRPAPDDSLRAGVERVKGHYDTLVDYPTTAQTELGDRLGIADYRHAEPRCRWPHFASDPAITVASAYVPTGWERLIGEVAPAQAPLPLGRAVLDRPERAAAELSAPFVLAVLDREARRLVIVNDMIAAGRLYELRFEGGRVWSNRAAAPLLFAGVEAKADGRGWRLLSAAGWMVGDATLLEGVRKVGRGAVVEADADGVTETATDAVGPMVRTTRDDFREFAPLACEQAVAEVAAAGKVWPGVADIDLSGGRDSRTVAGAALVAGIDARYKTSDVTPGEADVARAVVAAAPREMEHHVRKASDAAVKPHTRPLLDRALNVHLLHDGMRHPQKMRGKQDLPKGRPESATLSGHGGDVARGYFYRTRKDLLKLRLGRRKGIEERVMRLFAQDHGAAAAGSYEEARAEVEEALAEGRRLGVKGPSVLEWYYLTDRFATRTGVASHTERVSIFGTPGFIRAAFALTPTQKVDSELHNLMIPTLVPEWAEIPFFAPTTQRMRKVRRLRIWEAPDDAAAVEELIAGEGAWTELYDPSRVREAWAEVTSGGGKSNREAIFEGVVYREAFERYLAILRERAAIGPSLAAPAGALAR